MPSLNKKTPSWLPIFDLQPCTARLQNLRLAQLCCAAACVQIFDLQGEAVQGVCSKPLAQRTAVRANQGVACSAKLSKQKLRFCEQKLSFW